MKKINYAGKQGYEKEFIKVFNELCRSRHAWEVWADVISVMACSMANSVDRLPKRHNSREKEYAECISRLGGVEKPAQLFSIVVEALEDNPDQDFLGSLYMQLELGNKWKGQFFTPYHVSQCMAEITMGNCKQQIEKQGWISVCDPCVGGGAMLIAAGNTIRRLKINYQNHVLFVGQDIDRIAGMMAYIQMSLLGFPGYIVIGNSLTNPITGNAMVPTEKEGQEFWFTPFFFSKVWNYRRTFSAMDQIFRTKEDKDSVFSKSFFVFNFDDEAALNGT